MTKSGAAFLAGVAGAVLASPCAASGWDKLAVVAAMLVLLGWRALTVLVERIEALESRVMELESLAARVTKLESELEDLTRGRR